MDSSLRWLVLLAGPMRAGKSSFARRVLEQFGGVQVGFGDAVRQRTLALGLRDERRFWQQVGEEWVTSDPGGFCDMVMAQAAGEPRVIVDGVRHEHVYQMLRARAGDRRTVLVFVDADRSVRRNRLLADGADEAVIDEMLGHSTESELSSLRQVAHLIVDGTEDTASPLVVLGALIARGQR